MKSTYLLSFALSLTALTFIPVNTFAQTNKNINETGIYSETYNSLHSVNLSEEFVTVFKEKSTDYGIIFHYEKGNSFSNNSKIIFLLSGSDGLNYSYSLNLNITKASSVTNIIKGSKITDISKISEIKIIYSSDEISSLSLEFNNIENKWLGELDNFKYPSGAFFGYDKYKNGDISYMPYSYYVKNDGSLAKGLLNIDGKLYIFDNFGKGKTYSGFTKAKSGNLKYYEKGIQAKDGWQVIKNKRYYFDKNGYASVGKVKISDCTYYFDKNGVYTNKHSKQGTRPKDFQIGYGNFYFTYDSENSIMKKLINQNKNPVYSIGKYSLSSTDKQILWSIISEGNLLNADTSVTYDYKYVKSAIKSIENFSGEIYETEPYILNTVSFTANGKNYCFSFTNDIYSISNYDKTCNAIVSLYEYLENRVTSSNSYKNLKNSDSSVYLE